MGRRLPDPPARVAIATKATSNNARYRVETVRICLSRPHGTAHLELHRADVVVAAC